MRSEPDKSAAFLALLLPLRRQLEVYCRRMLRDRSGVEDALQAAVMTAFARFDHYAEGTNFRAWMFRFVTHEAFNRNRRRGAASWGEFPLEEAVESEEFSAPDDLAAALVERPGFVLEHLDAPLTEALNELPAAERTVMLLRAIGEFSYQEIRDILGIPLGSVMGYLSRARQKLRRSLAGYAAQSGHLGRPVAGETRS